MGASTVLTYPQIDADDAGVVLRRLLVTWRHPVTRTYHAVGMLAVTDRGYEFAYLRRASGVIGFQPLIGFPDFRPRYRSPYLFPLFDERVMQPSRPDRPMWLAALALTEDADPMEILARSGGGRAGDTIELLPEPHVGQDGVTHCVFLVHGTRHTPGAPERIDGLRQGDHLLLVDSDNPKFPRGLLVTSDGRGRLGWVPAPLLGYVHEVRAQGEPMLTVVRANGPDVGPHMRLLVRIEGRLPLGRTAFAEYDRELTG